MLERKHIVMIMASVTSEGLGGLVKDYREDNSSLTYFL